jgi:SulP family sulfate permease
MGARLRADRGGLAGRRHYEIDTNRELFGMGAANIAAGLSSGMVVGGSFQR